MWRTLLLLCSVHGVMCIVLCALWSPLRTAHAQEQNAPEEMLTRAKTLVETAQFASAEQALNELLLRGDLNAKQHNNALELSAIVHIAARREVKAQETLAELYRRDPEHHRRVLDPGPTVDAAFARAKQSAHTPVAVRLRGRFMRDGQGLLSLRLFIDEGESAVDSVHVFLMVESKPFAHLSSPTEGSREVMFPIPELSPFAQDASVYLQAQSPSGFVLGHVGDAEAAVKLAVPPRVTARSACVKEAKPLRREWWLWTTLGVVLSGLAVTTAVTVN